MVFKDRLTRDFIEELSKDFEEHGKSALEACRAQSPAKYLAIIASLVPKEIEFKRPLGEIDDDRMQAAIDLILAMRRPEDAKEIQPQVLLND